jgi:microcystin-dependent protein
MNIQQNPALFALIGTTYGGNGTTNFALPNLQGRAPLNPGAGPGLTPRQLAQTGGEETVTLSDATLPSHTHQLMAGGTGTSLDPNGAFPSGQRSGSFYRNSTNLVPMATQAIQPPSGSGSMQHANMQPYISMNFCIAMEGIWPDRP